jgi:hypothetical protein
MISLAKKFIFVHMPKTGGNSLQTILRKYSEDTYVVSGKKDGINRFGIVNEKYGTKKHSTLSEYKAAMEPELYDSMFKFAVVRNPWDRVISRYFSSNIHEWNQDTFIETLKYDLPLRRFIVVDTPLQYFFGKHHFRYALFSRPHLGIDLEQSLKKLGLPVDSSKKKLTDDIDFLLKFENLEEDYKTLCEKIDIPYVPLPRVNVSRREHYSRYYDEELKEMVRRKFAEEIEFFGYEFEESD